MRIHQFALVMVKLSSPGRKGRLQQRHSLGLGSFHADGRGAACVAWTLMLKAGPPLVDGETILLLSIYILYYIII
jgi:predicted NUDIX family phosphoesterase